MSKLSRLFLLFLIFSLPMVSMAQVNGLFRYRRSPKAFDVKIGVEVGVNRSWLAGDIFVVRESELGNDFEKFTKFKGRYAYHSGLYVDVKFTEEHYAHIGVRLTNKGWRQEGAYSFSPFSALIDDNAVMDKVEVLANISYLEIPLKYKYRLNHNIFFLAGPFFGIKLNESYKISNDFGVQLPRENDVLDHYLGFNYGLSVGFMYQHKNGFNLLTEYHHGIKNINDNPDITSVLIPRNHLVTASLTAGYTFMYPQRFTNYKKRKKGLL